jgi:hypothetical protein
VNINGGYGTSIAWAVFEGVICSGILGETRNMFRPMAYITREEMAVIFANYLENRNFPLQQSDVSVFYDLYRANPWATEAIQTMRRYGIIHGVGGNKYNPQANATRAEVAQIFANLVGAVNL